MTTNYQANPQSEKPSMSDDCFEDLMEYLIEFENFEEIGMDTNGQWPDFVEFDGAQARIWTEFYHGQNYEQGSVVCSFDLSELTDAQMKIVQSTLSDDLAFEVAEARSQDS